MRINYEKWESYWKEEMSKENAVIVYVSAAEAITRNGQYSDGQKVKMMETLSKVWHENLRK